MIIQKNQAIDFILRSLGENMDQKINYFDFLFEGFTSDLIEENDSKKKSVKKPKKKGKKTTSSGRQGRSTQDIVSNIWFP